MKEGAVIKSVAVGSKKHPEGQSTHQTTQTVLLRKESWSVGELKPDKMFYTFFPNLFRKVIGVELVVCTQQ